MCSKKFSVVKSGPPQAKFFLELWSRALGTSWGVAFRSLPFRMRSKWKSFYSLLLYSDFATLKCMTWLSLPSGVQVTWLNEPRMLHYGPSEDTAK
jgi:hypothetical protein